MSLWKIAWRSIQQRGLASALTTLSMACGVMLVVAVLSILGVVSESFKNNSSLGYNVIVGAKGGKLQLTLNTVYYLSQPVENVPYEYYLEFLTADKRRQEKAPSRGINLDKDGKYGPFVHLAIPLCLGDYYDRFRVVGTTPDLFDHLTFGAEGTRKYEFEKGRNFKHYTEENGYFEAVVGWVVAKEKNLKLGDKIQASHGAEDGFVHDDGFTVVGILKPTGTPNDRAAFVNMEGFYLMDNHAKPIEEEEGEEATAAGAGGDDSQPPAEDANPAPASGGESNNTASSDPHNEHEHDHAHDHGRPQPLPIEQREVTAILIRTINPLVTPGFQNAINEGKEAQAVLPVREIYGLFETFIKPIKSVLLVLTGTICVVSGISILVSIYNSMSERRHEIAVIRALGASRGKIMTIILLESVFLALGGGIIGWICGHTLNVVASPMIEARTGVALGFFDLAPGFSLMEFLDRDPWSATLPLLNLTITDSISPELLLIPALIVLAILVGILPAISAYFTDVAKSI